MNSFRSRLIGAGALVAAVALVATGCASTSSDDTSAQPETLVIDKSFDLVTADPARMFETTGNIVLHAVYDSLLTFEDGDSTTPQPSLAESYEVNDDATVYTFTLREGVTFSDGTPLTSADVVFSLNRAKNVQGNGSFLMDGLTVDAPDESTVVVTSESSNTAVPAILTSATLGIVNSAVVIENGGSDAEDAVDTDTAQAYLDSASAGSGKPPARRTKRTRRRPSAPANASSGMSSGSGITAANAIDGGPPTLMTTRKDSPRSIAAAW